MSTSEIELARQCGALQGRQAALAFTRITASVAAFTRELQRAGIVPETDADPADLLYEAWALIANAGCDAHRGRVDLEKSPGWHEAAIRWRDRYHAWLGSRPAADQEGEGDAEERVNTDLRDRDIEADEPDQLDRDSAALLAHDEPPPCEACQGRGEVSGRPCGYCCMAAS